MSIIIAIIGILATSLVLNFRAGSRQTALRQVAQQVASDLRETQSFALASRRYGGQTRCGYGLHYVDRNTYQVYVGPDSQVVNCDNTNKNFTAGDDQIVETIKIIDSQIEFDGPFPDIFFEPPDPTTYIDDKDLTESTDPAQIVLITATGDTKTVLVYPSGLVEVQQ
jgi:type II secretory pathway pseudopilin PulG